MITIQKLNEVYIRVLCDIEITMELHEFCTYDFPGAKFTPKFKAGIWDGKIRLFDLKRRTLYTGLKHHIYEFANARNYEIVDETIEDKIVEVIDNTNILPLSNNKNEILEFRDYQISAVNSALENERCVLLSPTGSGKSLIIYMLLRHHLNQDRKIILVTPNVSLVEQMYKDFESYSKINKFNVEENCQKLYSGLEKYPSKKYKITLENNKTITLHGNDNVKLINNVYKKVKDLINGDDIDEKWLIENNSI